MQVQERLAQSHFDKHSDHFLAKQSQVDVNVKVVVQINRGQNADWRVC